MKLKFRIGILVAVGCVAILGTQLVAEPKKAEAGKKIETKPAKDGFKPVLTVHQTMEGQGGLIKRIKDGILDGAWDDASKNALVLAELSNTNRYHNTAKDYQAWAHGLSKDCLDLSKALKKRDEAKSKTLLNQAGQKCSACHDVYKK